jgi:hypothetical protein
MYYPGDELTWDDILHPENIAGKPAKRMNPPQLLPPPLKAPCREGPIPAIYHDLSTNDPPRRVWYTPGSRSPVEPLAPPSPGRSPSPVPSPFNIVECDFAVLPGANKPLPSSKPPLAQRKLNYMHPYRRPFSPSTATRRQPAASTWLTYTHEAQLKLPTAKPAHKLAVPTLQAQRQHTSPPAYLMPFIRRFHSSLSYSDATQGLAPGECLTSASTVNRGDEEEDIVEVDTPGAREISSWIFPSPPKEVCSSSNPDSEDDTHTYPCGPCV